MMTIDEMRAKLDAAKYTWWASDSDSPSWIETPDEKWIQEIWNSPMTEEQVIQIAYAHLQREKQFQAMREFIQQVADARYPSLIWDITTLEWVKEAQQLLAEMPETG